MNLEYQRLNDFKKFNTSISQELINLGGNISKITELNNELLKNYNFNNTFNQNYLYNSVPFFNFNTNKNKPKKNTFVPNDILQDNIETPTSPIDIIPISQKYVNSTVSKSNPINNSSQIYNSIPSKITKSSSNPAKVSNLRPFPASKSSTVPSPPSVIPTPPSINTTSPSINATNPSVFTNDLIHLSILELVYLLI